MDLRAQASAEVRSEAGHAAGVADAPDHRRMHVAGITDALPPSVFRTVARAYPFAVARVRGLAACRALFERLGADPVQALMTSRYTTAGREHERPTGACQNGAAAITAVGSPEVRLCLNFGSLPTAGATVILVHEALHYAGLHERPADPSAMTSVEINRMVGASCGL